MQTFGDEGSSRMTTIESSRESRRFTRSLIAARASYRAAFSGFNAIAWEEEGWKEGWLSLLEEKKNQHKQTTLTSDRKFFAFKCSRC